MKCITTKYHGPTDYKGSRISVRAEGLPVIWSSFDYEHNDGGAEIAANAFADKYDWLNNSKLVGGVDYQGNGQWVMVAIT